MKFIEIHGAGFQNKGAELMLRAAVHQLRQRLPGVDIAIDPSSGSFRQRALLGLYQMFPKRGVVGGERFWERLRLQKAYSALASVKILGNLINSLLNRYRYVSLSQVQALVDIAGFAYSDEWGKRPTLGFSDLARTFSGHGKPVILMPQAFGPFEKAESRAAFRSVIDIASLIYARDRRSFEHVLALAPGAKNVFRAPDITLFYPDAGLTAKPQSDYISIVPNVRMLDKGRQDWAEKYEDYLVAVIEEILRRNLQVKIIVHDISGQDIQVTQSILARVNSPHLGLVESDDPLVLKEEIGKSRLLVGSRYHSLIAAFSQAVPSIGLGWSHKYEMLFEDFDCMDLMVTSDLSTQAVVAMVTRLLDDEVNAQYRVNISKKLGEMRKLNEAMWDQVTQVLGGMNN
jgi:polysaccharide pyruvyl transferase WcaK-like protein